jgi:hypothetical protein
VHDGGVKGGPVGGAGVGEFLGGVVPVECGDLVLALFISVSGSVVAVEGEAGVSSGVDAERSDGLLFVGAFDACAEGQDGACTDEQRNGVDGCGDRDALAAVETPGCSRPAYPVFGIVVTRACRPPGCTRAGRLDERAVRKSRERCGRRESDEEDRCVDTSRERPIGLLPAGRSALLISDAGMRSGPECPASARRRCAGHLESGVER